MQSYKSKNTCKRCATMQKLRWLETITVCSLAVVAVWIACDARDTAREAIRRAESTREQMTVELDRAKKTYDEAMGFGDGK
jgi:hypothetical protein